jgi:osmotically-inducible protein OsmY
MQQVPLTTRIARQLLMEGIRVAVEEADGVIRLSGTVESANARDTAAAIAARIAPDKQIENNLTVDPGPPEDMAIGNPGVPDDVDIPLDVAQAAEEGVELDPGFTDQPLEIDPSKVVDPSVPDDLPVAEPDPVYFPPTDPVVTVDDQGRIEVTGGFAPTSMSDLEVEPSAEDNQPGDEALADAIRRELHEDALTTDLRINVLVRRGVAYLRGSVPALQDAENTQAVADRIPGVREVVDELTVPGL